MDKITLADRFKVAGKELVKLNLGNVAKSFGLPDYALGNQSFFIGSNSYNNGFPIGNPNNNNGWVFGAGGSFDSYFDFNQTNSSLKAYQQCPPVAAILQQKAQAFINGVTYVMGADGKESDSPVALKIKKLFQQPNPLQSWDHFEMQYDINTALYGYTVILPIKPVGFDGTYATQLWPLPGNMVEVEVNDVPPYQKDVKPFKSITFLYGNSRFPLPVDEVFIIKDSTPSFSTLSLPNSRIPSLSQPINNVIGALQSRGVLIVNRGPRFVISNGGGKDQFGTTPWTNDEKKETLDAFKWNYGLMANQSQAIITSAATNVDMLGYDVKQLGLMEEVQESSSMICIGLGFPKFLAGLSDPTFNNQDTAEKALYQRFEIPKSKNYYGQWNAFFNTSQYGLTIVKDYSAVPVLQEDKTNLGRARFYMNQACQIEFLNNIITVNMWLQANNLDTRPDGDVYYTDWLKAGVNFGSGKTAGASGSDNTNIDNENTGAPQ